MLRNLLIVAHSPSPNTCRLRDAAERGARHEAIEAVSVTVRAPLETGPDDVLGCDGILLGTPENLGTMSGALKDFFDRSYYPLLDECRGLPCALYVRAGHDGTGTCRAVETIVAGLGWQWAQPPLVLRGEWQPSFVDQVEELGLYLAAAMDAGIV